MYLPDAGIVLELRKARAGRTDAGLPAWASSTAPPDMVLSAVSLLEPESGAARLERPTAAGGAPGLARPVTRASTGASCRWMLPWCGAAASCLVTTPATACSPRPRSSTARLVTRVPPPSSRDG